MNIRPENVCTGSGATVVSGQLWRRTQCHRCARNEIRIKTNGALFIHSNKSNKL